MTAARRALGDVGGDHRRVNHGGRPQVETFLRKFSLPDAAQRLTSRRAREALGRDDDRGGMVKLRATVARSFGRRTSLGERSESRPSYTPPP